MKAPAEMKDIFSNMEMSMEYTIINHNSAQDFEIPEAAINAPELAMPIQ